MPARVLLFDADGNDSELPFSAEAVHLPSERQLLWVDIEGQAPQQLPQVLAALRLSDHSVSKLATPTLGRPALAQHEEYVRVNINAACAGEQFTPLVVIAGRNFVLTSHPEDIRSLTEFREQTQGDTQLGQLDSAAFMAVLLMRILETYFQGVECIEEATDRLDEVLLRSQGERKPLEELVELRRRTGELRRELSAHRPLFMHLASPDFVVYAGDEHEAQFNTLLLQFEHALDSVAHSRELVLGSFDLYMTSLGQRTNDTMRVLTVVTIALGILAAVAGFMGMNFQADLFKTGNTGFRDVLIFSALLIVVVLAWGRWRKWL